MGANIKALPNAEPSQQIIAGLEDLLEQAKADKLFCVHAQWSSRNGTWGTASWKAREEFSSAITDNRVHAAMLIELAMRNLSV
jgi:inorganic triphosphatase YgiF